MSKYLLLFVSLIFVVSCQMKVEPTITVNVDECEHCTMVLQDIDHGSVLIDSEEQLHTYCSPVCMILEKAKLKTDKSTSPPARYLFDHNSLIAIPVFDAYIVHGEFNTAMGHGLLAFADKSEADQFANEMDGEILSWNDLRIKFESPDKVVNLSESSQNNEVAKNDLVSIIFNNSSPEEVSINLLGYEFEMAILPNSEDTALFIAAKPGQGFVFQKNNGENISALFVTGDHTSEESDYK